MAELSWREQHFTLDPPLVNARGRWSERRGLVLTLQDDDGRLGHGECSPLPGYSSDTVDDAERALNVLARSLSDELTTLDDARALLEAVARLVPSSLPALRFALETAALDRLGQARGAPLWRLLGELTGSAAAPDGVALAALLPGDDATHALAQARELMARGVQCFKLKLGPGVCSPAQLATFEALRRELPANVSLRLDANASLDPARLAESLHELAAFTPELVEEPIDLAHCDDAVLRTLAAARIPIALDESLRSLTSLDAVLAQSWCDSVVLKPTTLGGFLRCNELAQHAVARGRGVIVSHTFEGPVGWAACAQLALALGPARAAGLWPQAGQCPSELAERVLNGGRLLPFLGPGLGATP
ncbi:MAG: o-succinylbenzoate synthase [Polyangiaceae bacterium]